MINVIQEFLAKIILGSFDYLVSKFTENKAVLQRSEIPFYDILVDNRLVFLNEYLNVIKSKKINDIKNFYQVKTDINEDNKWKAEPIVLFNYLFKENAEKCPQTFALTSKIPGCCAVMFSVLEPGKYIPPHKGIYKGAYRCLFTLKIEENADCWIRIEDTKINFKEGELVIFDERAEHEVMNASKGNRVALYLDLYRNLPFPLNVYNKIIYYIIRRSPFVQNVISEYNKLENSTVLNFKSAKPILK